MDQVLTEEVPPGPGGDGESPIGRVRPRVRRDVVFAQTSDGAFLRHAEGGFVMKGRTAYQWIAALLPHFTGENTVAELCSGLSGEQQELIGSTVSVLLERGFVRDFTGPPGDDLPGPVAERYQGQLEFIEHYTSDAGARFARFRASRVLVAGEGTASVAAAESLLRNGLEQVTVQLDPRTAGADLARLATEAHAATEAGAAASVSQLREQLPGLSARQLGEYDVIIAFADQGRAADAVSLARRLPAGPALLPVTVAGHRAVLGPLTRAGATPCLICLLLRLGANLPAAEMADLWRGAGLPELPAPSALGSDISARMIGNAAAFDVFRWRTGTLPAETDRAAVIQDLETLDTVRERLLPHPLCPSCRQHQNGAAAPLPSDLTAEQQLQRLLWLVAAHAGVFSGFEDGQIDQSPLKVGQVRLGAADFAQRAGRTITAFDLNTPAEARQRALYQATQVYLDQVADQVRGVATPPAQGRLVRPESLHNWAGVTLAEPFTRWVAATSFPAGELCYLPAEAVCPAAQDAAGRYFEVTPAGRGAGPDRARAVTAGLGSALAYYALRRALAGRPARLLEPPRAVADDSPGGFLVRAARQLGIEPRLYLLPGAAGHPVVLAVAADEPTWSVGWGADAPVDALRDLVGQRQLIQAGVTADLGDELVAGFDPGCLQVEAGAPARWEPAPREPGEVLLDAGLDALIVDVTPLDLRETGVVSAVQVLLAQASQQG